MCSFVKINPVSNFRLLNQKAAFWKWIDFYALTRWARLNFKVDTRLYRKKMFLLETEFSWPSLPPQFSGMRNVDSCTLPSWCRSICFVLVTINTFLGLLSTMLWRHLTHSKTMAQACSSVIGALKHNCQSHLH